MKLTSRHRLCLVQTLERDGSPHNLDLFETIIRINLTGTFNAARLTAARLVRDVPKPIPAPDESTPCRGVIVTVASQAGLEGQAGQLAYATSKAGVAGMALPMARDLAWYSIRTVAVCPSIFETPMSSNMPARARAKTLKTAEFPARFGRPDEFAHAVQSVIENDMLNGFALSEWRRAGRGCGCGDGADNLPHVHAQDSTVLRGWPSCNLGDSSY